MDNNNYENPTNDGIYSDAIPLTREALGLPSGDKEAFKKASSRSHLSLFLYLIITYVVSNAISIFALVICRITENAELYTFLTGTTAGLLISSVAQYAVAFPLAVLLMRLFSKPRKYEKSKLKIGEVLMLFVIAEAFMIIGSMISNALAGIIGGLFNFTPSNSVETIVNDVPVWLIFIVMVILAPIAEEIIFRKLLIDRIGHFGDGWAIVISALAFALIHTNIYQFIYALMVGLVFGYIYTRTRDVRYTIVMHALLNFLGSVVALFVQRSTDRLFTFLESGTEIATEIDPRLILDLLIVGIYSTLQYGMLLAGIVLAVIYISRKMVILSESAGTLKMKETVLKSALLNPGAILFYVLCIILSVISLFLGG